jgi:hypothetical protein
MRCFVFLTVTSILSFLASSAPARADAPSEDPEALIRLGNELRRTGDNVRAEGYFSRAYQLARTPRSAAQLGLVELAVDKYFSAEIHLTEALASDDSWVRSHATEIERSRSAARQHLVGVQIAGAPADATLELGAGQTAPLGRDATVWVAPGTVSIKVVAAGYRSAVVMVAGRVGERSRVEVQMPALAEAGAPPSPPPMPTNAPAPLSAPAPEPAPASPTPASDAGGSTRGRPLRIFGITAAAVGVAAGVAGTVLLLDGRSKASSYFSTAAYNPSDANYYALEQAGVATLVGAGVLVAGGVALYALGARADAAEAGSSVSLAAGPHFGGLLWRGSF